MTHGQNGLRIVVNADDLGASDEINDAVFQAMSEGVITSATLMATGAAKESAARTAQRFPQCSFGVHMNLTTHRPLTSNPALGPLLDDTGHMRRTAVYEVRPTSALVSAVADEWTAQVEWVRKAGVPVSHLDSHHHTHTVPWTFVALKRVQKRTGIRRVRSTWTIYDRKSAPAPALRIKKRLWIWALQAVYRTRTTDEFTGLVEFLTALQEGSYAPRSWPRTMELMVHPTGDMATNGEEAAALRSGWLERLPVPATLVPFHAL
jgi:predicted glycoside hydrolase/deacetylase ChbG (UPF0249 family)